MGSKIIGKIGLAIIKTTALVIISTVTGQMLKASSFDVAENLIAGGRFIRHKLTNKNEEAV